MNQAVDIPRLLDLSAKKAAGGAPPRQGEAPAASPAYASFSDLDENPPQDRQWIIDQWIARGTVGGLFGGGGVGKSLLVQQLASYIANGVAPFERTTVAMGPVLGFFCEDDNLELRRRQRAILAHMGRSPRYSSEGLHLEGRAGLWNAIVTFDAERRVLLTPFAELIERECERLRPVALILDNIAQLYAGIENDRHEVTAFCNVLAGIAIRHNLAVLLLGHVGKAEGSEYSGSTAWENAVRTRLWLERRDDGLLELHRRKANYAARDSVTLEYRSGAFAQIGGNAEAEAQALLQAERDVLSALDTLTARQVATSQLPTGRNYLPRLAAREGLLNGTPLAVASRALAALIDRGELLVGKDLGWKKSDRHPATGIARRDTL